MKTGGRLYTTDTTLRRTLTVAYPAGKGRMVLRTEQDWDRDIEATSVGDDGTTWTFELEGRLDVEPGDYEAIGSLACHPVPLTARTRVVVEDGSR